MEKFLEPVTAVVFEFGFYKLACWPGKWVDYWDCQLEVGMLEYPFVVGLHVPGGLTVEVARGIIAHHLERFGIK